MLDIYLNPRLHFNSQKMKPFYSLKPYKTMKKFFLVLFAAGLTTTATFAQAGDPTDEVTVTVNINDYLELSVISGDNLVWNLTSPLDYTNPSITELYSGLRVSSARDNAAVSLYGDADLIDAATSEVIPMTVVEYGIVAAGYTPVSVSATTPSLVADGISAGITDISVNTKINIPFGVYAPGGYTGQLYYTATYQ